MLFSEIYQIIQSEGKAVAFLKEHGLLPDAEVECIPCHRCGCRMRQVSRKKCQPDGTTKVFEMLRCPAKGCQAEKSIRHSNAFFTWTDDRGHCNNKLSICQVLELVFWYTEAIPQVQIASRTRHSRQTIVNWFNLCRDVPVGLFSRRQKMGGIGCIVQIDESLMRGRRKSHKGRYLLGDNGTFRYDAGEPDNESLQPARNYGNRVEGPWVFGLCTRDESGILEARFFVVAKRNRKTLMPIIMREVATGSTIHSDEWGAYSKLGSCGFCHETVNHQEYFVDPETHANTQRIESLWGHLKKIILREMHGTTPAMLERHLQEHWWRWRNKSNDLFLEMLEGIRELYR